MRNVIVVLSAALVLGACASPQERGARKQAEMAETMVVYGPACERLGFAPQSDQWRSCILNLSTKDEAYRYGHPAYGGYYGTGYWGGGYWNRGWR